MITRTVTAADATLFHVAADAYGDATAAIRIAQASGVMDPWLDGVQTLLVPETSGRDTGGLPAPGTTL